MSNAEKCIISRLTGAMSRRSFLRMSAQLPVVITSFQIGRTTKADPDQAPSQAHAYGVGIYGQGLYVGSYRAYLPLLTQEGD